MLTRLLAEFLGLPRRAFRKRRARRLVAMADQAFRNGAIDQALQGYRDAIRVDSGLADAHNNLGIALQSMGQSAAACTAFERVITIDPDHGAAHYNRALIAIDVDDPASATKHLTHARRLLGETAMVSAGLGRLASHTGDMEAAVGHFKAAWDAEPGFQEAADSYLLALANCATVTPTALAIEHKRAGQSIASTAPVLNPTRFADRNRDPDRPLTVGYISPDFREHSVRYFFEPLIAHHDRQRFRIICYNDTTRRDGYTESLRLRADIWRDIAGLRTSAVAKIVLADQPDIMVELAGHTAGNRLSLLAARVAPIQISGLGYPPTTGVPAIDYKLTDAIADPPGADRYYSERLIRLAGTFWCYLPPADCPDPAPAPCQASGTVTFGCFGNVGKINAETLSAWQHILAATPQTQLLIKSATLGNAWNDGHLRERLAQAGLPADRVLLQGPSHGLDFQRAFSQVDLILDTYPYNGGTTTAHALWMSVPVLTHAGSLLLSRMGASMLAACAEHDLIADSWEEYIDQAVQLANDMERLIKLRSRLRSAMMHSALTDGSAYVAGLESAYRTAWRHWCKLPQGEITEWAS